MTTLGETLEVIPKPTQKIEDLCMVLHVRAHNRITQLEDHYQKKTAFVTTGSCLYRSAFVPTFRYIVCTTHVMRCQFPIVAHLLVPFSSELAASFDFGCAL